LPPTLTDGIPTPQQVAAQKAQYAAALDKQLQEALATVKKESEIEKQMIKFNAEKNIALFKMQMEEQEAQETAMVDERAIFQTL